MKAPNEPRRPSLATIVGSSLAVAAAGSLLAFGSLAEQAGLQGLAVGGLQPAEPGRTGRDAQAITIPAPATAPPQDPHDALATLVRETVERRAAEHAPEPQPLVTFMPEPRAPRRPDRLGRPDRLDSAARVAVAGPDVADEPEAAEWDGPPYGRAYGHYKDENARKPKPPRKKHAPKVRTKEQPVYARTAAEEPAKGPKPAKLKKVEKTGNGKGKAKGHSKHAHGKGKGKGHAKHGG